MRRVGAGIFVAVLALAGCKSTDSKPTGREPTGAAASRTKSKDPAQQKWLDPSSRLPGADTNVPRAKNWGTDPKSPNFNAKAEAQDAVGGKVVDGGGRAAKNVFIRVDAVNAPAGGTGAGGLGIMTDQNGYFFTRGLKPGQTYNLTAEATQDGKPLVGTMQTRVPNPIITIILREDNGQPKPAADGASDGFPPPPADSDHIPPLGASNPHTPRPTPTDAAFSPGNGANRPVPATIGSPPGVVPSVGPLPAPDDLASPTKPLHPENVADGPRSPFTPPTVNIPGPPGLPPPLPNPVLPKETPERKQSLVRPGANFVLIDTLERNWDFATDKSGSFVLLEFVTTACPNCKPAVPVLKDLQSRYGADGLQVVAVLCDEVPQRQRTAAAARYARDNNTNYAVYVEPGPQTGTVRDHFRVEGYPTAILLDATGSVLWKGHPAKRAEIEAAVRRAVGR